MSYYQTDTITSYQFEIFEDQPVVHGVFTRNGGVSPAPWRSLNLGGLNGDSRENVIENRRRIFNAMERQVESIFDVWQVHGNKVICTDQPRPLDCLHQEADAILTDCPEITLFMRFADCVPLLLHDPVKKVVGMVHAGWMGTVNKIIQDTIQVMNEKYQSKPENIIAGIGPSIGVDHYQVGDDVVAKATSAFNGRVNEVLKQQNGSAYFDLWMANYILLLDAGVKNIQVSGVCTACNTGDWFSHRGEHGKTGRFGAMIALR